MCPPTDKASPRHPNNNTDIGIDKSINSNAKPTPSTMPARSSSWIAINTLTAAAASGFGVQIIPNRGRFAGGSLVVRPNQWKPFDGYRQQQTQPQQSKHISSPRDFIVRSVLLLLLIDCGLWRMAAVTAAPQSCILCNKNDLSPMDYERSRNYEEFVFEHQVTRKEAIDSLQALNDSFYRGPPDDSYCKSITCTKNIMKYCLSQQFINDHCLCELGHKDEGLPFVPHICYVGEKLLKPSMGSCYFYEELKECCCGPVLALQWRHISASSNHFSKMYITDMLILLGSGLWAFVWRRS